MANRYYFKERPDQEAFVDHGERLRTRHNQAPIAKAMLDLAQSRGWDTIHVNGQTEFKQAVWLEASLKGIQVTGYMPAPQDQAALRTRQQAQDQAKIRPSASPTLDTSTSPTPAASPTPAPARGSAEWYVAHHAQYKATTQHVISRRGCKSTEEDANGQKSVQMEPVELTQSLRLSAGAGSTWD
ncbi:MAG TPA: LPD7 domain-containing protein [Candidatus Competibacteraceae bacterium]|nr:LPD7 domain-containing protein [Candidatus Competibacteraceae bacterium]